MDYGLFFFHSVSVSEHLPACAAVASVSHTCKICLSLPTLGLNFGRLDYLASGCQEMPLLSFRRLMIVISVWLAKLMIAAQPWRICSMVSKLGTVPMTINVILTTPRPGIFLMGHSGVTRPYIWPYKAIFWGIPSHRPWALCYAGLQDLARSWHAAVLAALECQLSPGQMMADGWRAYGIYMFFLDIRYISFRWCF